MTDLSVIILAKNEKLHIRRCLEKLSPLEARQVFVVDCFSDDGTQEIARQLGATVVDALAHGKPCIASTCTSWEELAARSCGWWVSNEPPVLAKAIREMMDAGDARRRQMGERGQALVREKYTWDAVAASLCDIYRSL